MLLLAKYPKTCMDTIMQISQIITESIFAKLAGRDGLPVLVWKNPSHGEFSRAVAGADPHDGIRCILTEHDMFLWQSMSLLHTDFIQQTGISGVKISLHRHGIAANLEAIAAPEDIPWVSGDREVAELDNDERQALIEDWLRSNGRLRRAYTDTDFTIHWYM